jgi:hemolysin activation/secretion protein
MEQERKAQEEKRKQEQITEPKAPPQIEKPPRPRVPRGAEARVRVTQIKFSGNTVIRTKELEEVVASAIGKVLTLRELNEVAGQVSEYYVGKGYILAQAYLPPQEIRGGVVEIAVLEGKVGKIGVTGNTRYKSSTILRALEPVRKRAVVHEATLETALNELNDYPGLKVRGALKPGETRGLTDLELTARERIPYTLVLDIDNYGSRLTGPWRYGSEIGIGNIFGIGDNLKLKGSKSDDNLFFTNVDYVIPLTSFGTKLELNWVHSENVIGEEFASTRPIGRADIATADILQTITRTGSFSLTAVGGFDFKTIRNIISGTLSSKDEIRIFRLGLRGDYRDPFLGRTYFGVTAHYLADFWGASQQNAPQTSFAITKAGITRGAGPGRTTKGTADVARFQSLGFPFLQGLPVLPKVLNDSYLILRATGQISSDRMLSPERFSIGGYFTVRGYQVAERIGDNGYAATAEMVVPIPSSANIPFTNRMWKEAIQLAAFIDHGGTFATPIAEGQGGFGYLTGAGGGLRISLPFGVPQPVDRGVLSLKIDWASAIGRPRPSSRDQGISLNDVYGDGAAGVLYVSAALRF